MTQYRQYREEPEKPAGHRSRCDALADYICSIHAERYVSVIGPCLDGLLYTVHFPGAIPEEEKIDMFSFVQSLAEERAEEGGFLVLRYRNALMGQWVVNGSWFQNGKIFKSTQKIMEECIRLDPLTEGLFCDASRQDAFVD